MEAGYRGDRVWRLGLGVNGSFAAEASEGYGV